jgi:hypothetical protein
LKRPATLLDEVILAIYLIALDRSGEALQILTFLGHNVEYKEDDLEQWRPVALGICVQARLLRQAKRGELANKAMQKVAARPFLTANREQLGQLVSDAPAELAGAFAEPAIKAVSRRVAQTLLHLMALEEMRRFDKNLFEGATPEEVEEIIGDAANQLGGRMKK